MALVDVCSEYPYIAVTQLSEIVPPLIRLMVPPPGLAPAPLYCDYQPSVIPLEQWRELAPLASELLVFVMEGKPEETFAWNNGKLVQDVTTLLTAMRIALYAKGDNGDEWLDSTVSLDRQELIGGV
jgi:hypothetical protein